MAIPMEERKHSDMEVQLLALDLAEYTIDQAEKDKIVSKRCRWSIGDRLIDAALDIARNIDLANTMRLDMDAEAQERRMAQDRALACLFQLRTLVHIARRKKLFELRIEEHWVRMTMRVQELLSAWKESDRARRRALARAT